VITTTLGALITAEPTLERLAGKELSAKFAYHLAKLTRLVRQETAHYHETLTKLRAELGDERDATPAEQAATGWTRINTIKPEHLDAFTARLTDLNAVSVEIDGHPIDLDRLDVTVTCERCGKSTTTPITMTPKDIEALWPLLAEPPTRTEGTP
jgi:hypothetical protein